MPSATLDISQKVAGLWPEIVMLLGAVTCLFAGLNRSRDVRKAAAWIAAATLVLAGVLLATTTPLDLTGLQLAGMTLYVRLAVVLVGLVLLMVAASVPGEVAQHRAAESAPEFDAQHAIGGEFFAFFLFSLTGVMLTAGASDLAWLFLSLELVSLPTYVMVATTRDKADAQEAAVKYFFLGALATAVFLYGFTLIYGATGFTDFTQIQSHVAQAVASGQPLHPLLVAGVLLSVLGICFKIAAFPMHFYAADVYQGANTAVTTFLAFVPKTAGFIGIILILSLIGWPLDKTPDAVDGGDAIVWTLWVVAALTMTVGNVLGLLQDNVKRVLAYSSVAQSGYIAVALLAGPAPTTAGGSTGVLTDGIGAVLFYLVAYGFGTIAAFAALGCLRSRGEEAQTFADLSGLRHRQPGLAAILAIASLSLLGIPPLVGFLGKVYLFAPALAREYYWLVVIAVINSAISAGYYLRIASAAFFGPEAEGVTATDAPLRRVAAAVAATASIALGLFGGVLVDATRQTAASAVEAKETVEAPVSRHVELPPVEQR